ncbi:MAG: type IV pilus twitching motility protein PilT [Cyanobacteria bacterium SZAS LIN-5]|nr:type IV pilus twitching motility protein PilT [Cyanobacteria bacterium SZAS LIN-5]RTL43827.1 MAG: type IV pilus twitching motility protein PilT [Candidatus Melainabacteria bacterium]
MLEIQELLQLVFDRAASDLHIKAGQPPIIRVAGKLIKSTLPPLSKEEVQRLIFSIITSEQRKQLEQTYELDCSFGLDGIGRFRVNVYKDRGSYAAALRVVASRIPSLDELNLPPIVKEITQKPRGLILITGATGQGKSTTLASMIDWINENRADHILTIEDPIEFIHQNKRSILSQRELGQDTKSFANALKAALREDPDVILVGEMRDLDTIHLALTAAETGHLVFGTVHTSSAAQSIDRVIDVFPPDQQQQIRIMLSNGLVAIVSQTLLPRLQDSAGGNPVTKGRILAAEVLVNTPAIANLIRESKTPQIYSTMQMGGALGMQTLEASLAGLVKNGLISLSEAMAKTTRPEDLERLCGASAKSSTAPGKNYGSFGGRF